MGNTQKLGTLVNGFTVDANGNVGIATTPTTDRLTISGNTTVLGSVNVSSYQYFTSIYGGYIFGYTGTTYTPMTYSASYHAFSTSGTEKLRIINSGNVGIGTSSPNSSLHILKGSGNGAEVYMSYGSTSTYSEFVHNSNGGALNLRRESDGGINTLLRAYGNSYLNVLTGNVGIGTSSPVAKLHIYSSDTNMASTSANSYTYSKLRIEPYNGSSIGLSFGLISPNINYIQASYNEGSTASMSIQPFGGNVGIGTSSPTKKLQVNGDIYSTDTVFGRNIKPEAWTTVSAGSPSSAGIPMGHSTININSVCDNQWRTVFTNINDAKFFMWVTLGDAASKDTASYSFAMTSPAYGVSSMATLTYTDGGWNTGGFEFTYSSANGTHTLLVRCSSYYNSGNTAYGTIYFLRLE